MNSERERCIALAGLFQATELASQVARRGIADTAAMEASIHSLFQVDADSVEEVYTGLPGVTVGLKVISAQLDDGNKRNIDVTRYVISLLHLERKLAKRTAMLDQIGEGIRTTAGRLDHFHLLHPNILAGLAEIYSSTVSQLRPRIMVQGDPLHLQNPENINRVRTLLLAGIRSAMLWRQCGGGRLQILLGRKKLLSMTQSLLQEARV